MEKYKLKNDPFKEREANKYEFPIPSREFILICLKNHSKQTFELGDFYKIFNIRVLRDKEALRRRLIAMVRDGQLVKNRNNSFFLLQSTFLVRGKILGHPKGFGFVNPIDNTSPIFISAYEMRKVFDGDEVDVRIINPFIDKKREGIIENVIQHKIEKIAGRFYMEGEIGFVIPFNKRINRNIIIPDKYFYSAKHGEIVIVKIKVYPSKYNNPVGKICKVLGTSITSKIAIEVALYTYDISYKWPKEVQVEVEKLTSCRNRKKSLIERIDLSKLPFLTIDDIDAKDFDDAIFCTSLNSGWQLLVAISDVSYYVEQDSAIDEEAYQRANSIYFPNKVIPMLPEKLSNDICSLKAGEDRLVLLCDMIIDKKGGITKYQFYPATICPYQRLTYDEATEILANPIARKDKTSSLTLLEKNLHNLFDLYSVLAANRKARGGILFESRETKIEFNKKGQVGKISARKLTLAHKIVEECMLAANNSTASLLFENQAISLYRVHEGIKEEQFELLKKSLLSFGLSLPSHKYFTPKNYRKIIEQSSNRKDSHIIHTILLRSLTQAFYSTECDLHFGLALDKYTHFTSPIRRYADLMVHRSIYKIIAQSHKNSSQTNNKKKTQDKIDNTNKNLRDIKIIAQHCSSSDKRSEEIMRDMQKWLKCEYLAKKAGEIFKGIISRITPIGLFVDLDEVLIEGLVHVNSLKDDKYLFDPLRFNLYGEQNAKIFHLGMQVLVIISKVDLQNYQIELTLKQEEKD